MTRIQLNGSIALVLLLATIYSCSVNQKPGVTQELNVAPTNANIQLAADTSSDQQSSSTAQNRDEKFISDSLKRIQSDSILPIPPFDYVDVVILKDEANPKIALPDQVNSSGTDQLSQPLYSMDTQPELRELQAVSIQSVSRRSMAAGNRKSRIKGNQQVFLNEATTPEEVAVASGLLTAGEINDFGKWNMWDDVANGDLEIYRNRWMMFPKQRFCVIVQNELGAPVPDAHVEMLDDSGTSIWIARTDNTGKAELWQNFFHGQDQPQPAVIRVSSGNISARLEKVIPIEKGVNSVILHASCGISDQVDIMFAVDATASMGDEIEYLKMELTDIINRISTDKPELSIRTGSLFYKCPGNDYVTRPQPFTSDINTTVNFISKQSASDGGDEAVEQAMMEAVNQFEWSSEARARLLFMVLDEPPGAKPNVVPDIQKAIQDAARKGIRIIPLVSSGVTYDIDKSLEYLMRCVALGTNGSYTFLTNHSGVGNQHTAPSTDSYDVEKLNELLIRVIDQFTYFPDCPAPQTEPAAPLVADTSVVDIEDGKKSWQIELFPNPARFEVNLRSERKMDEIVILDLSGKLLYRFALAEELFTLQLDALTNGHYIARCRIGEEWKNLKFVVSK